MKYVNECKVSWWKEGDLFPLFIGDRQFVLDPRFSSVPVSQIEDTAVLNSITSEQINSTHLKKQQHRIRWTLFIHIVHFNDSGNYSCEISSNPPKRKHISLEIIGIALDYFLI